MKNEKWISVNEALPEPFTRAKKMFQGVLAYVKNENNIYGGCPMILFYGKFAFYNPDAIGDECDDDGMISRFGWHYERDSEGEFDSLIFDMNGKVTHWMPLPESPNVGDNMSIEESLMQMNREDALRIIVNVLEHFNDDRYRFGVAFCYTRALNEKERDIILLAPPNRFSFGEDNDRFVEIKNSICYPGYNEGKCQKCNLLVSSDLKSGICPLCGSDVGLT